MLPVQGKPQPTPNYCHRCREGSAPHAAPSPVLSSQGVFPHCATVDVAKRDSTVHEGLPTTLSEPLTPRREGNLLRTTTYTADPRERLPSPRHATADVIELVREM